MAQTRRIAGLDPQFTQDDLGNLYEDGAMVAPAGQWDAQDQTDYERGGEVTGTTLTINGRPYGPQARYDELRDQGYLTVESIGRLDPSQFNWPALDQQLGLTPVIGPSGERMLSMEDRRKVDEWGYQQGILQDQGGFGDFAIEALKHVGPVMMGAPALLGGVGATTMLGEIAGNLFGSGFGGMGAFGDVATGIDSLADFNGLVPGNYTDLGGILGSGGEIASAVGGGLAPVSDGVSLLDPLAEANGLQVGDYTDLGGTLQPGAGGAVGDPFIDAYTPPSANVPQGTWGAPAATSAGGALTSALNKALGLNLSDTDTALLGKLAGAGIGLLGANQQSDSMTALADKYLNLGAPARARLEQSYADPGGYLNGPDMQAFLGQSAKQQANALSYRFGNPAISPNANQELLNSTANLASQGIYNYRNQLAAQGGLGVAPAAQFDAGGAQAGNTGYNIAASVLGDATNPQQSIIEQMRQLAKLGGGNFLMAG